MPDIAIKGLKKKYDAFALDVDLEIRNGEFMTVIGPSGSGKSTLLSLIAGLDSPDSGQILADGKDLVPLPPQKRSCGLVFQDYALFTNMNVAKNITYSMKLRKMRKAEMKEGLTSLLELVNLSGYEKRKVTTLSGGEAQRVALARALSARPSILLLDEPLSALDAALRRRLRDEIRRIHDEVGNLTTVYVTHDREEAFSISDRIAVMRNGKVEMVDCAQNIYRRPENLFTAFFSGEGTALPAAMFNIAVDCDTVFFRPEAATVKEDGFPFDGDEWLIMDGARVQGAEYLGRNYLLGLSWNGHRILAEAFQYPKKETVSLYIHKSDLLFYRDGELVR